MFELATAAETLSLLGDESRIRLCVLLKQREMSVSELVRVTGLAQSRVSSHLSRLREARLVRDRRAGQSAFYALAWPALPRAAQAVIDDAVGSSDATLAADKKRLVQLDEEGAGALPASFAGEMERHYSPGRTWQSLAVGLGALLELGDVLDVGSGDGAAASYLARGCASLTCVDTSARMIAAAKQRLAEHAHVRAEVADVHDLPFRAASFDAVLLFHTLTYVERPPRAVAECARVLRPGGRLVILSLDAHEHTKITAPYGERHAGFSPRALRSLLTRAGLEAFTSAVASREAKKPHFNVVLAVARKARKS